MYVVRKNVDFQCMENIYHVAGMFGRINVLQIVESKLELTKSLANG